MRGFVFLVLALVACKPKAGSEVQSLDNFAAGKVKNVNFCQAAPSDQLNVTSSPLTESIEYGAGVDINLHGTVATVLTSVPQPVRDMFHAMGGRIVLTKDAPKLCAKARRENGDPFGSCFVYLKGDGGKGKLRIFAHPDVGSLHHGLVRTFGYFFSQFVTKVEFGPDGRMSFVEEDAPKLRMAKAELSVAFLADVAFGDKYSLKTMDKFLGVGAADVLERNLTRHKRLTAANVFAGLSFRGPSESSITRTTARQRLEAFQDYVFAEAFDSYHCNTWSKDLRRNTLKVLERDFPTVFKMYPDIFRIALIATQENASGLNAMLRPYLAGAQRSNANEGGFGLQDGSESFEEAPIEIDQSVDVTNGASLGSGSAAPMTSGAGSGYFDAGNLVTPSGMDGSLGAPVTFENPLADTYGTAPAPALEPSSFNSAPNYNDLLASSKMISGGFVPQAAPTVPSYQRELSGISMPTFAPERSTITTMQEFQARATQNLPPTRELQNAVATWGLGTIPTGPGGDQLKSNFDIAPSTVTYRDIGNYVNQGPYKLAPENQAEVQRLGSVLQTNAMNITNSTPDPVMILRAGEKPLTPGTVAMAGMASYAFLPTNGGTQEEVARGILNDAQNRKFMGIDNGQNGPVNVATRTVLPGQPLGIPFEGTLGENGMKTLEQTFAEARGQGIINYEHSQREVLPGRQPVVVGKPFSIVDEKTGRTVQFQPQAIVNNPSPELTTHLVSGGGAVQLPTPSTRMQKAQGAFDGAIAGGGAPLAGMGTGYLAGKAAELVTDDQQTQGAISTIVGTGTEFVLENREAIKMGALATTTYVIPAVQTGLSTGATAVTGTLSSAAAGVTTAGVATAGAGVAVVGFTGYQLYRLGSATSDYVEASAGLARSEERLQNMATRDGYKDSESHTDDIGFKMKVYNQHVSGPQVTNWINNSAAEAEQMARNGNIQGAINRIEGTKIVLGRKSEWLQTVHDPATQQAANDRLTRAMRNIYDSAAPKPEPQARFGKGGLNGVIAQ